MIGFLAGQNKNVFQNELLTGEEILWSGQPDPSVIFSKADIILLPFIFFWFVPFLLTFIHNPDLTKYPLSFVIPFLAICFYFSIGRFFFKKIKKHRTYYAVTNKRVLILTNYFSKNLVSEYINTLPAINKKIRRSGIGTIIFGNVPSALAGSVYTGPDGFKHFCGPVPPSFYDIKNANKIYNLVAELRNTNKT